jgi:hypothetical protein
MGCTSYRLVEVNYISEGRTAFTFDQRFRQYGYPKRRRIYTGLYVVTPQKVVILIVTVIRISNRPFVIKRRKEEEEEEEEKNNRERGSVGKKSFTTRLSLEIFSPSRLTTTRMTNVFLHPFHQTRGNSLLVSVTLLCSPNHATLTIWTFHIG